MSSPASIESAFTETLFEAGYNAVLADIEGLAPEEVVHINVEIMAAVTKATGALPKIRALRGQIVDELPRFDIATFDKLHDYALAAAYAHAQHLASVEPREDLKPLYDLAVELRERLIEDVQPLTNRALINAEALRGLQGINGYKNVATDLQLLVQLLKANWTTIQSKCAITEDDLARSAALATRIVHVLGLREQGPTAGARSADVRARAFTLFSRTYDHARRAVRYLRWLEGDADKIAPSLYAGRGNGRKGVSKKLLARAGAP